MATRHTDHFAGKTTKNNKQFTVYKEGGPGKYLPPKDFFELAKRVAPPISLRIAASSVAFLCAGVVQTYIALRQEQPRIRGR